MNHEAVHLVYEDPERRMVIYRYGVVEPYHLTKYNYVLELAHLDGKTVFTEYKNRYDGGYGRPLKNVYEYLGLVPVDMENKDHKRKWMFGDPEEEIVFRMMYL